MGGGPGSEGGTSAALNQSPLAQLLQFEENYGAALDGYARAAALAPDWTEPRMRRARLLDYLSRICAAVGGAVSGSGRGVGRKWAGIGCGEAGKGCGEW